MSTRIHIVVEPLPHANPVDVRLRNFLKFLLRKMGLRCLEIRSEEPGEVKSLHDEGSEIAPRTRASAAAQPRKPSRRRAKASADPEPGKTEEPA